MPLDRERRAVWRARLRIYFGAGRLTRAARDVGLALLDRLGVDGRCDPSHATLAADARCKAKTVGRALAALADCGLLRWTRRLIRAGWRAEQTSNAYALIVAGEPPRCDGHSVRGTGKRSILLRPASKRLREGQGGDDEWGRRNAERQLALLLGSPGLLDA